MLKYRFLTFILVFSMLFLPNVSAFERTDYLKLISNTDQCFDCEAVYELCQPKRLDILQLAETQIWLKDEYEEVMSYNKFMEDLNRDFSIQWLINETYYEEDYYNYEEWVNYACTKDNVFVNESYFTKRNETTGFPLDLHKRFWCWNDEDNFNTTNWYYDITQARGKNPLTYNWNYTETASNGLISKNREVWETVDLSQLGGKFLLSSIGACFKLKLSTSLQQGEAYDHFLTFVDDFGVTNYTEYDWFNNSWGQRRAINVTNNNGTAILVNQTPVNFSINWTEIVDESKGMANASDLRVTYDSGSGDVELDRYVVASNGLHFNGTSKVNVTETASLDILGDMTVALWVKFEDYTSNNIGLLGKRSGTDSTTAYSLDALGSKVRWIHGTGSGANICTSATNSISANNKWYHVVATINGTSKAVYIDGVKSSGSCTFSGTRQNNANNLVFGTFFEEDVSYRLKGTMDEVAIWNRTLTEAEIQDFYNYSKPVTNLSDSNLVGLWHFDELMGNTTVYESSGNSNLGILLGANFTEGYIIQNLNQSNTTVWFKTQADIGAGASNANYYVYYNNSGAGNPPEDTINVFQKITPADESDNGLVSLWRLDEGSGSWANDSLNLNNGTVNGATWSNENSSIDNLGANFSSGSQLNFDGSNDYVSIPDSNSIDFTGVQSVSLWLKTTGVSGRIISNEALSGYATTLTVFTGSNIVYYRRGNGVSAEWTGSSSKIIDDGFWHHVVAVDTGSKFQIYVDGVLDYDATPAGYSTPATGTGILALGRQGAISGAYYSGSLDEVAVWNRTLSQEEVIALYERRKPFVPVATAVLGANVSEEENTAPNVTLESPNNVWNQTMVQTFNYNPNDDAGFANCSLYTNETGSWAIEENNATAITNASTNSFTHTFPTIGTYLWNVQCWDNATTPLSNFSDANFTINIQGNDTIRANNITVNDFSFSSGSYVQLVAENFTTTASNSNFTPLIFFNVRKTSGGGTNNVSVRVNVSGVKVAEQVIRSISSVNSFGSAGLRPFVFNVANGDHNITVEFLRTGTGTIEISNFDFVLIQARTNATSGVLLQNFSGTTTFSSTNYVALVNSTLTKQIQSPTLLLWGLSTNVSGSNVLHSFYDQDNQSLDNSSVAFRRNTNTASLSSMIVAHLSPEESSVLHNHTLFGRTASGSVTANYSTIYLDLRGANNRSIQTFDSSHVSTNQTNFITLGAGLHNVANATLTPQNGTSMLVLGTASFNSTGSSFAPSIILNATTASQASCRTQKNRTLSDTGDAGNSFAVMVCSGLTVGVSETFNLWVDVPSGKTITLLDEDLMGFEVSLLNLTPINLAPIANEINAPLNGTTISGNYNFNWTAFSDPNGDTVTYNISIMNTDLTLNTTVNASTTNTNDTFDTTSIADGDFTLNVTGCDPSNTCAINFSVNFSIDNTIPNIDFVAPTISNNTVVNYQNFTYINASLNNAEIDRCTLDWNGTNETATLVGGGTSCFNNKTGIANGVYTYRMYVNDTGSNSNVTELRTINFTYSQNNSVVINTTNSTYGQDSTFSANALARFEVNCTPIVNPENLNNGTLQVLVYVVDPNTNVFINNESAVYNTSRDAWYTNKTVTTAGNYTFTGYCQGTSSNWNASNTTFSVSAVGGGLTDEQAAQLSRIETNQAVIEGLIEEVLDILYLILRMLKEGVHAFFKWF